MAKNLYLFFAGYSVLVIHSLMSPILYLREMSGLESRELPQQAGALPT
jgi:hypothetical protein